MKQYVDWLVRVSLILTIVLITSNAYAVDILKTGQKDCYDSNGAIISCIGTGQDGEFQKGNNITSGRFTNNGDGTVTDIVTGLMWMTENRCVPWYGDPTLGQSYEDIQQKVDDFNNNPGIYSACVERGYLSEDLLGKYNDWRIPTVREMESLSNMGYNDSSAYLRDNGFIYPYSSWTSTPQPEHPANHYIFNFSSAYGGASIGTWHNTTAGSGNTISATNMVMICRGEANVVTVDNPETVMPNRFETLANGKFLDKKTGLIWMTITGKMNFQGALNAAKLQSGMRVPNRNELMSIYSFINWGPHLPTGAPLTGITTSNYWTSTTNRVNPKSAWAVTFGTSTISTRIVDKLLTCNVLLVADNVNPPTPETPPEEPVMMGSSLPPENNSTGTVRNSWVKIHTQDNNSGKFKVIGTATDIPFANGMSVLVTLKVENRNGGMDEIVSDVVTLVKQGFMLNINLNASSTMFTKFNINMKTGAFDIQGKSPDFDVNQVGTTPDFVTTISFNGGFPVQDAVTLNTKTNELEYKNSEQLACN